MKWIKFHYFAAYAFLKTKLLRPLMVSLLKAETIRSKIKKVGREKPIMFFLSRMVGLTTTHFIGNGTYEAGETRNVKKSLYNWMQELGTGKELGQLPCM